eukprot:TRINITY_DN16220_c0_g1_i2.p1 TRINITY_DN16220_c0_g1~~TRINITY_DN16220_c0_g1_i2.p1  ORF type:complete len:435 (-),score=86.52 TRINITY_DN16220_c0_g1_i2:647-1951(-)
MALSLPSRDTVIAAVLAVLRVKCFVCLRLLTFSGWLLYWTLWGSFNALVLLYGALATPTVLRNNESEAKAGGDASSGGNASLRDDFSLGANVSSGLGASVGGQISACGDAFPGGYIKSDIVQNATDSGAATPNCADGASEEDAVEIDACASVNVDQVVLQQVRLRCRSTTEKQQPPTIARVADVALEQARLKHTGVRFSVHGAKVGKFDDDGDIVLAVFGPRTAVTAACSCLAESIEVVNEVCHNAVFALHFTLRGVDDVPHDEELLDASLEKDWVDLGSGGAGDSAVKTLIQKRMDLVLPSSHLNVHIFMDTVPLTFGGGSSGAADVSATTAPTAMRVDLVGASSSSSWDAATKTVSACEASGVYLSANYDILFWYPEGLQRSFADQVARALSNWKGMSVEGAFAACCVAARADIASFEDLAATVTSVFKNQP